MFIYSIWPLPISYSVCSRISKKIIMNVGRDAFRRIIQSMEELKQPKFMTIGV